MSIELMQLIKEQSLGTDNSEILSDDIGLQYLTFIVGSELFSVDILQVQEIRAWENTTCLPNAPHYMKGVLNLRGAIVPVIDLRVRFGFKNIQYSPTTVVIILKNRVDDKEFLMGCVVDAVSNVYNVDESEISEVPNFGSSIDSRFIQGIMTIDNSAVTLLNLENLLSLDLIEHPHAGNSKSDE